MKRSALRRGTPLRRGESQLKRTPLRRAGKKMKRDRQEMDSTKVDLLVRSGGYCEAQLSSCWRYGTHHHHILRRSQGGDNSLENGLWICEPCHESIHRNPSSSMERGFLRSGHGA